MSFDTNVRARLEVDAKEIIGRYPRSRSALLPLLHLMQAEEGYVGPHGIEFCADALDLTTAEVAAVATFYSMYKRRPGGTYNVGVCTNTLCAVMGGDEIFATLKGHLGVGHDETTEDGRVTLEHLECNAACDYAPVVMVNWEFFDNQTPESAMMLVDDLRSGREVRPTRGPRLCTFREVSRVLAGFPDGLANDGPGAGPPTLLGLDLVREQAERDSGTAGKGRRTTSSGGAPGTGYGREGGPSGLGDTAGTAQSDPAHSAPPHGTDRPSTAEASDS